MRAPARPGKARRAKQRRVPAKGSIEWSANLAELFRIVPTDYSPPSHVIVRVGVKTVTWTGRFKTPSGDGVTAVVRGRKDQAGKYGVSEEILKFAFGYRTGDRA